LYVLRFDQPLYVQNYAPLYLRSVRLGLAEVMGVKVCSWLMRVFALLGLESDFAIPSWL
jgi:hypothetical protein